MYNAQTLPLLEQTIFELIAELLLLEQEKRYPNLLFSDPEDIRPVRVTAHYVMALIAYGFDPADQELEEATEWFDVKFPRTRFNNMVDTREMNRLMVLLHLKPEAKGVRTRLEHLANQYHGSYYDVQPGWQEYDTLWALQAFTLAKNAQVLDENIVTDDRLRTRLDQLITDQELKRDKDVALALRLQHKLVGELYPTHIDELHHLLENSEKYGIWGLREFGWERQNHWLAELSTGKKLTYQHVEDHRDRFRKIVLSTCMVIENLVPMMDQYPEIREPVERALGIWWQQFQGTNAVTTLRHLFPRPYDYDYLLVLSRTLRAVREYIRRPLRSLDTIHLLRQLTTFKTNNSESSEMRSIKAALRNWINVDINGQPERLKLGFSEANVVRVNPYIGNPMVDAETTAQVPKVSLVPNSLIIKYGPTDMINAERANYNQLPAATRDYFVRIPEDTYYDAENNRSFVIMQDLRDYQTLYEVHEAVSANAHQVADQLGVFLQRMHEGPTLQYHAVPRSTMRELYISPMMGYIDRIFNFVTESGMNSEAIERAREIQYDLFERIGEIIRAQRHLEHFQSAYMHGDLHMRNIMVRGLYDHSAAELTFKLIDLEFTRQKGDAAFDAGQLLVDIELVSREEQKLDHQSRLLNLKSNLERSYSDFGKTRRDDHTFGIRMELAKARALLRIAKGKTKRGGHLLETEQEGLAERMSEEVVQHASEALLHLNAVITALEAV